MNWSFTKFWKVDPIRIIFKSVMSLSDSTVYPGGIGFLLSKHQDCLVVAHPQQVMMR
jgi:hypothetical protein